MEKFKGSDLRPIVARAWRFILLCACGLGALAADKPRHVLNWVESQELKDQAVCETLHAVTEADDIEVDFTLDPKERAIRGTARLRFSCPGRWRTFDLCVELEISDLRASDAAVSLFRQGDRVFVLGEGLREIQVDFQGTVRTEGNGLLEKMIVLDETGNRGSSQAATLFSRTLPFIPSSNRRFARTRVRARLRAGLQCLISGMKREAPGDGQFAEFVFESAGSKGVAISLGDFRLAGRVPAAVPVNLYLSADLHLDLEAYGKRLRSIVDFFVARFGPPAVPELNLLVQKESFNGGCSFGGYLINYLREDGGSTSLPPTYRLPPMFLYDSRWDSLIHEIAHQWWGGLISWQKADDAWISEGLAQYSTLLYWQDSLPEKTFAGILERMCAGVVLKAAAGKTTDAVKLAFVTKDPVAFQVVVYNKAALIFWMLDDLLGEEKLLAKLKLLLDERRFQCLGSEAFVQCLAGDDPLLKQFFSGWVGRAEVPAVVYRLSPRGGKVWLEVGQTNGPFVFPLQVCCRTNGGVRYLTLPIQRKKESFAVAACDAQVRSIEIKAGQIPVRIGDEDQ